MSELGLSACTTTSSGSLRAVSPGTTFAAVTITQWSDLFSGGRTSGVAMMRRLLSLAEKGVEFQPLFDSLAWKVGDATQTQPTFVRACPLDDMTPNAERCITNVNEFFGQPPAGYDTDRVQLE